MELTKKQAKKFINFLEKYKYYLGMGDWTVRLAIKVTTGDALAEVEPDIQEKILQIQLSENFMKKSQKEQMNILFHELLHGRVCICQKRVEQHTDIEEEHMVNDIVRGFEETKQFEW